MMSKEIKDLLEKEIKDTLKTFGIVLLTLVGGTGIGIYLLLAGFGPKVAVAISLLTTIALYFSLFSVFFRKRKMK